MKFKNYPESKQKDQITIVEREQSNAGFIKYTRDIDSISKSPAEWENLIY